MDYSLEKIDEDIDEVLEDEYESREVFEEQLEFETLEKSLELPQKAELYCLVINHCPACMLTKKFLNYPTIKKIVSHAFATIKYIEVSKLINFDIISKMSSTKSKTFLNKVKDFPIPFFIKKTGDGKLVFLNRSLIMLISQEYQEGVAGNQNYLLGLEKVLMDDEDHF
ncbi:hypothetical protein [Carp edema virus]|nr:hypothetical protein [Carp edema virus]